MWKVIKENNTKCLNTRLAVLHEETMRSLIEQNIFLSRMMQNGIFVSMMAITGTVQNNNTKVACALEGPDLSKLNYSQAAFLRVIGKKHRN